MSSEGYFKLENNLMYLELTQILDSLLKIWIKQKQKNDKLQSFVWKMVNFWMIWNKWNEPKSIHRNQHHFLDQVVKEVSGTLLANKLALLLILLSSILNSLKVTKIGRKCVNKAWTIISTILTHLQKLVSSTNNPHT